ncbi:polyphosphate:AMP phosphotransferase [Branchiibius hedensis]|uniref:Polyphosphate:nucleotide phosphotransferase, PPK2 family n=1 Tax=Branchiibius hedensis TaxID=672460 RepID=A0A2Y8ZKI1_9MICO|nr:PPK2 family polyphosphate kinase [Branchiibius hedensis]PWJ24092.1 polyphosphate:AMP phosphotransferase [Branchiibius hedensis]SSA32910.1 polyphosphate:nucleotide phosphotransferase, PPK2 family [Branchiibius hedensis]
MSQHKASDEINYAALAKATRVTPGSRVDLRKDFDPGYKDSAFTKTTGKAALEKAKIRLFELQDRLYAEAESAVLIVLQAIDAAGKDSTIKHVMSGVNPEGVDVYSFKAPSATEREHDYLWRHQLVVPPLGRIAVFNRSHYENVTVTRVHPEFLWPRTAHKRPHHLWQERYRQINDWERYLTESGTTIVKLFLNVSQEEQRLRFLERVENPAKNWKVSPTDMAERAHWPDYTKAFSEMLSHTSTQWAPWHVIPADHKWFSHLSTFGVILTALEQIDPHYPKVDSDTKSKLADIKAELTAQAPKDDSGKS